LGAVYECSTRQPLTPQILRGTSPHLNTVELGGGRCPGPRASRLSFLGIATANLVWPRAESAPLQGQPISSDCIRPVPRQ
jgi:hypothetical protein